VHQLIRELDGKSSDIPHLAKNERDVGHPGRSYPRTFCSDASLITRELTAIKQFSTKQWEREAKEE
jgi:hypothetical protein